MTNRPLILLSNDDGVQAAGLLALRRALLGWAEVIVVAPLHEQSANSHAITLDRPLRHHTLSEGVHAVDGTPADCVYVAFHHEALLSRQPDVVVSGINHGAEPGQRYFLFRHGCGGQGRGAAGRACYRVFIVGV